MQQRSDLDSTILSIRRQLKGCVARLAGHYCPSQNCGCSSVGRAPPCQGGRREFEPRHPLLIFNLGKTPTIQFKDLEERTVPMTAAFQAFIRDEYGLREPFMLHPENEHGKNRCRYDFRRPFYEHMKAHGCPWVTPHIMRHTFASLLASMEPMLGSPSDFEIATWMEIDLRTYAKLRPRRGAVDKAFQSESKPGH